MHLWCSDWPPAVCVSNRCANNRPTVYPPYGVVLQAIWLIVLDGFAAVLDLLQCWMYWILDVLGVLGASAAVLDESVVVVMNGLWEWINVQYYYLMDPVQCCCMHLLHYYCINLLQQHLHHSIGGSSWQRLCIKPAKSAVSRVVPRRVRAEDHAHARALPSTGGSHQPRVIAVPLR